MPKALNSCPKSNKSHNLVTVVRYQEIECVPKVCVFNCGSHRRNQWEEREREKGSKNIIQCECVFNEEESGNKKPKSALTFVHHIWRVKVSDNCFTFYFKNIFFFSFPVAAGVVCTSTFLPTYFPRCKPILKCSICAHSYSLRFDLLFVIK